MQTNRPQRFPIHPNPPLPSSLPFFSACDTQSGSGYTRTLGRQEALAAKRREVLRRSRRGSRFPKLQQYDTSSSDPSGYTRPGAGGGAGGARARLESTGSDPVGELVSPRARHKASRGGKGQEHHGKMARMMGWFDRKLNITGGKDKDQKQRRLERHSSAGRLESQRIAHEVAAEYAARHPDSPPPGATAGGGGGGGGGGAGGSPGGRMTRKTSYGRMQATGGTPDSPSGLALNEGVIAHRQSDSLANARLSASRVAHVTLAVTDRHALIHEEDDDEGGVRSLFPEPSVPCCVVACVCCSVRIPYAWLPPNPNSNFPWLTIRALIS